MLRLPEASLVTRTHTTWKTLKGARGGLCRARRPRIREQGIAWSGLPVTGHSQGSVEAGLECLRLAAVRVVRATLVVGGLGGRRGVRELEMNRGHI